MTGEGEDHWTMLGQEKPDWAALPPDAERERQAED